MSSSSNSELAIRDESLLVQIYNDTKKAISKGWNKVALFNKNRQLVKLIDILRGTEASNTKTIAYQVDGLSAPLWTLALGSANSNELEVLSWAKSERIMAIRDQELCQQTKVAKGTLIETREIVLGSTRDVLRHINAVLERLFEESVIEERLVNSKSNAVKQMLGTDMEGTFAGDLGLCQLFRTSCDDVKVPLQILTGDEVPFGLATNSKNGSALLLLKQDKVFLLHKDNMYEKYLEPQHISSISPLKSSQKSIAKPLSKFIYTLAFCFQDRSTGRAKGIASSYLNASNFAQVFLSLSSANMSVAIIEEEVCGAAVKSLKKDASKLEYIRKTGFLPQNYKSNLDLKFQEIQAIHGKEGALNDNQRSRIVHDLSFQEEKYLEAGMDNEFTMDTLVGTLSDDEHRQMMLNTLYSKHKNALRESKIIDTKKKEESASVDALKLNLAVMCYNRLTGNESATQGFQEILKKHLTTIAETGMYKAIYTPHSGAAVLYFNENTFSEFKLRKYQPFKCKQESILGIITVLHEQINTSNREIVDRDVHSFLSDGLDKITAVQDVIMNRIRIQVQPETPMVLKVSDLFISAAKLSNKLNVIKWMERELLAFFAYHGVPIYNQSSNFSSMYVSFSQYYQKGNPGVELLVDKPGNIYNVKIRVTSSGSFLLLENNDGWVLKVRCDGKEIYNIDELDRRLEVCCRPASGPFSIPQENYTDVTLNTDQLFC